MLLGCVDAVTVRRPAALRHGVAVEPALLVRPALPVKASLLVKPALLVKPVLLVKPALAVKPALLVKPGDSGELARVLSLLLADSGLRLQLSLRARETFVSRFSADAFTSALKAAYAELGFISG